MRRPPALPFRPIVDEFAPQLAPLDWTWTDETGPLLVVASHGFDDDAIAIALAELDPRSSADRDPGPWYELVAIPSGEARRHRVRLEGSPVLVKNPEIFLPVLRQGLEERTPENPAPIPFAHHAVSPGDAPRLWRALAVLEDWGLDPVGDRTIHGFLWDAYLRLPTIRTQKDPVTLGYALEKVRAAIDAMAASRNPVLACLGEAAADDLETAVCARVEAELAAGLEDLAQAVASAASPRGEARARAAFAVKVARLRRLFGAWEAAWRVADWEEGAGAALALPGATGARSPRERS